MNDLFKLADEYRFDIDKWSAAYPLSCLPATQMDDIANAAVIALFEQIRSKYLYPAGLRHTPVDLMVLARGEPARRDVTKVGGLPFRPSGLPWPHSRDGHPMTFLAQYRFQESKEFLPRLSGDLLLIYVRHNDFAEHEDPTFFHFEWQNLQTGELIKAGDQPQPAWKFVSCFGVRHRSVDFLDLERCRQILLPVLGDYFPDYVSRFPERIDERVFAIARFEGIKIGGVAYWEQPEIVDQKQLEKLRFLCSLTSIVPKITSADRWLNRHEPESVIFKSGYPEEWLYWMDGFVLNLFLDDGGHIVHFLQWSS